MLGIPIVQADDAPLQPDLNQLDAQQQQRQNAHINQQSEQLQPQPDIRSQSESSTLTLPPNESPCYPIQSVTLTDYAKTQADTQFKWALDKAVSQLNLTLPRCLGGEGVGVLMKQIQNNIIEKGFVTTRIVAGEQNLSDGKLVLTVIPGKIRRTIVADSSPVLRFTRLHSLTGLTFSQGDLLNIRDIEQSLENLKRPPTVEANIEILPAEGEQAEAGESDVKISYAQALPFRLNFSLDDSGSKSTGKWQGSGTFSFLIICFLPMIYFTAPSLTVSNDTVMTKDDGQVRVSCCTIPYLSAIGCCRPVTLIIAIIKKSSVHLTTLIFIRVKVRMIN